VPPVRCELGFYFPDGGILHSNLPWKHQILSRQGVHINRLARNLKDVYAVSLNALYQLLLPETKHNKEMIAAIKALRF
jgi:hypothetical protein